MNSLQYGASVTTLFVVALSGLIWLCPNVRKMVAWRENVQVVRCNSLESAVVANSGDGEVFLSHIFLFMTNRKPWVAKRLTFESVLPPEQFLSRDFPPPSLETGEYLKGIPAEQFDALLDKALNDPTCFEVTFFQKSDPSFVELNKITRSTLNVIDATGYLEYSTPRAIVNQNEPKRVLLSVVGVLRKSNEARCSK